jgi:hypothetical protein
MVGGQERFLQLVFAAFLFSCLRFEEQFLANSQIRGADFHGLVDGKLVHKALIQLGVCVVVVCLESNLNSIY